MSELQLSSHNLPALVPDAEPPVDPGSAPLRNHRHEHYARKRSLLMPRLEAARAAGYENMTAGNAAKLDRNRKIATRIAYLCRQEEDILKAKRQRIEEFLWNIHEVNYADFWSPDDKGRQHLKPFSELPLEHQHVIQSLKYTEKGRPVLELYSKLQANMELRKMLGIGAVAADGMDEYSRMADVELFATLRREAAELGIDVDLTYRFKGSEAA